MHSNHFILNRVERSALATNTVLRNTYILLGLTFLFSALTAGVSMWTQVTFFNPLITLVGYFGLLFLTNYFRNSAWGLLAIFALTGFMGYTLGPILNYYLHGFSNGHQLVMMSLGASGIIFFALSAYALISRKDFSFIAGFLMTGMLLGFLASIATLFFHAPVLMVTVSALFVLLSSGVILLQTSQIIHGGETNYITATVTLYVSIYNLFLSLLNILGVLGSDRD